MSTTKLARGELYPLADRLPFLLARSLTRAEDKEGRDSVLVYLRVCRRVRARWTGAKRPPKRGEWYLSGSEIEAYRAPNDLSTAFHIAELVEVEQVPATLRAVRVVY